MNNQDFQNLLSSSAEPLQRTKDGKARFDNKQIISWDKELKTKYDKRVAARESGGGDKDGEHKAKVKYGPGAQKGGEKEEETYRDRAQERRKGENATNVDQEEQKYADLISKLGKKDCCRRRRCKRWREVEVD
jgi:hypothetical protein